MKDCVILYSGFPVSSMMVDGWESVKFRTWDYRKEGYLGIEKKKISSFLSRHVMLCHVMPFHLFTKNTYLPFFHGRVRDFIQSFY